MIGFNARADKSARDILENESLTLRYYNVIYDVIDDYKSHYGGMLEPNREEIVGSRSARCV